MFISESELFELTANLPPERNQVKGGVLDGDDDVNGLRRLAVERVPQRDGAAVAVHAEVVAADGEFHAAALGVAPAQVVHLHDETRQVSSAASSTHMFSLLHRALIPRF